MGIEQIRAIKAGTKPKSTGKPYRIPKVSAKRAQVLREKREAMANGQDELEKWFSKIMLKEKSQCWETGEAINKKDRKGWRGSIAHILPKRVFPSVATHPLNYLILSMWNGSHSNFDSSWAKASKMKVWPVVVERFKKIYPAIAPEERGKIPDVLLKTLDKNQNQ